MPNPPGAIVIDSKFPLEAYESLRSSSNSSELIEASRMMKTSVRQHIKSIAEKYIIEGETAEGAIMFLPSEAVYAELHANFSDVVLRDVPKSTKALPGRATLKFNLGINVIDYPSPQSVVFFTLQGIKRTDQNFFDAFIMNHILGGGGFNSRLMKEIREKRGLTYSVSTSLTQYDKQLEKLRSFDVFSPYLTFQFAWNKGINFGLFSSNEAFVKWVLIFITLLI